jgi:NADPH:quinone reductase-like Zn-dependent oxidoreductase
MAGLQQTMGDIFTPWTTYPFVVGSDVAGKGVEVGNGVRRLRVGDRVIGYAAGSDKRTSCATVPRKAASRTTLSCSPT